MFSVVFRADTLEYNGYYADLRGWAKGVGGGCQTAALIGSCKQMRPISCYELGVFLDRDGVACNPCPPPPLKLVHSFFDHSRIVLLKEAP